jgi:integrase
MTGNTKISIRNYRFEEYLNSISNWKIAEEDKKALLVFVKDYELGKVTGNQAKPGTIKSVLVYIKTCLEYFNKPSSELILKDIEKLCEDLLKDNLKKNISSIFGSPHYVPFVPVGKIKLKDALRLYLTWKLKDKVDELTKLLKLKPRLKETTPDYIKDRDIEKLYNACTTAEQRYILTVLFDSGARAEEFHNIRVEDIDLPKEGESFVKLTLKEEYSKTKGRVISLYWKHSLDAVREYLNQRIDEGAKYGEQMIIRSYRGIRQFLARLGKRVLNRHVHYHLFRHSSATYYADKMNRQQLCIRYGWRFSSPMPDRYINRGGVHQEELDKKFESTKFEDLKQELEKQARENSLIKEKQQKLEEELEKRRYLDPLISRFLQNPKLMEVIERISESQEAPEAKSL